MKRIRSRFLRVSLNVLVVLVLGVFAYIFSFGPASAWVADTIAGQQASTMAPATYDARLSSHYRFYGPLIRIRLWLVWHGVQWPEHLLTRYEGLFVRPTKLADGREVLTTVGVADSFPLPGESVADYVARLGDPSFPTPLPGTALYALPQSRRVLVVLAPGESDLLRIAVFDAAIEEYSPTCFADLRAP